MAMQQPATTKNTMYIVAWWQGGKENGYWYPTMYWFESYQRAQYMVSRLAIDGHTYTILQNGTEVQNG